MKVWYLPLEPYRERYTEQLVAWTSQAFRRRKIDFDILYGTPLKHVQRIQVGPVLDARGRSYFALTQMGNLIANINSVKPDDWLFIEDMFTPGYEALPYLFDQMGWRPKIATRNYAQSMDPDDFTFAMRRWMRHYEQIIDQTVDVVFVASTAHKELWEVAGLDGGKVKVVGLPFDSKQVRAQCPTQVRAWRERPRNVVYASRLDREKQPHFFMDVVEALAVEEAQFVFCTGADAPRSNDETAVMRLHNLAHAGRIRIAAGLSKAEYYAIVAHARVQLNTARQDFISFTAIEASTFGVPTLAPAFRAFPEALENRESQLYVPWSVSHCVERLRSLLDHGEPLSARLVDEQDKTFDRMFDVLEAI